MSSKKPQLQQSNIYTSQAPQTNSFTHQQQSQKQVLKSNYINELYHQYFKTLDQVPVQLFQSFPQLQSLNNFLNKNLSIRKLYQLVIDNMHNHSYSDSIFFADKLVTLTDNHPCVVYLLAQCYYLNGDYQKVHSLFVKHQLLSWNLNFQILAARSLHQNQQYEVCLSILDLPVEKNYPNLKLEAQKFFLKAQCHESSENKANAVLCYFECLQRDPTCIEAFNRLIDCYLLTNTEKEQLLTMLNFNPEDIWIRQYYISRIKEDIYEDSFHPVGANQNSVVNLINSLGGGSGSNSFIRKSPIKLHEGNTDLKVQERSQVLTNQSNHLNQKLPQNSRLMVISQEDEMQQENLNTTVEIRPDNLYETLNLKSNIDILCIKAKIAHAQYDISRAYEICVKAIKHDPLYFEIIPIYCACLLDLNYLGEIYYCAHNLVENYANHPLSWFAIGTYYYLTQKYEVARKYFQKAIMLDRNFIYAWIGLAHSYAIQDESDQAMSIYRTVSRLFPGCYAAHLYMGMEYLRTNNLKTAQLSFNYAKEINGTDPLVYNELGVIQFRQRNYPEAKEMFQLALDFCKEATNWVIETIYSNLAHTYRKLKDYQNAIKFYEQCITLNPSNAQTYFSLAFAYHISHQLNKAICFYHKSLHYKYDNQFAHDMLARCLSDASDLPWENVYNV